KFKEVKVKLDMDLAYTKEPVIHTQPDDAKQMYREAIANAELEAEKLPEITEFLTFDKELTELMYFYICNLK
ncbi:MAG: hypothetical protein JXR56_08735, partial [Candidatus Cloacimonetes bacterium]|nr:hypothetical protein [Candidatus Cloacimonadota bacterium]